MKREDQSCVVPFSKTQFFINFLIYLLLTLQMKFVPHQTPNLCPGFVFAIREISSVSTAWLYLRVTEIRAGNAMGGMDWPLHVAKIDRLIFREKIVRLLERSIAI